jgi:hypothetical protein
LDFPQKCIDFSIPIKIITRIIERKLIANQIYLVAISIKTGSQSAAERESVTVPQAASNSIRTGNNEVPAISVRLKIFQKT